MFLPAVFVVTSRFIVDVPKSFLAATLLVCLTGLGGLSPLLTSHRANIELEYTEW